MNKKEKRYILSDVLLNEGANQVSSYLKHRKVMKYIKENVIESDHFEKYENKVINAPDNTFTKLYDKITINPGVTLAELLPHVIKKNKRSYAR